MLIFIAASHLLFKLNVSFHVMVTMRMIRIFKSNIKDACNRLFSYLLRAVGFTVLAGGVGCRSK